MKVAGLTLFCATLVCIPLGVAPELTFLTGVVAVLGVICSGAMYVAREWKPIRGSTIVATMLVPISVLVGSGAALLIADLIRSAV